MPPKNDMISIALPAATASSADERCSPTGASATAERLYRENHARLLRLCTLLLLGNAEEARDVCQEVFMKCLRECERQEQPVTWPAWLNRVAVNACRDRRRSAWWRVWRSESDVLDEGQLPHRGPTPEQAVLGEERRAAIWAAFRRLPARQREVFALRYVEGWPTEETADALGVTTGSIKRHLFRAVQRMRSSLGSEP